LTGAAGVTATLPFSRWVAKARAAALSNELSDPALQPKFVEIAPNALDPGFKYSLDSTGEYTVGVGSTVQETGLVNPSGKRLQTPLFGYGQDGVYTWPGKTFEVMRGGDQTTVNWENNLFGIRQHLLPLDTSLHWAYSLHGYQQHTIPKNGIPIITHVHGGHSDFQFDGNPEFFYNPGATVVGPQWDSVPGGFTNQFVYDNDVPAGNLWYHDHALGITRLNVYAGMAGFYFVRDDWDTGAIDNPLGLPAYPYELAYALQDRMFKKNGRLFYPAFPGNPAWADFITGEGLQNDEVPKPSALAEFFGDHMVVNGKIWPKVDVEPRNYRMRLLNGCDSRFLVVRFRAVPAGATDLTMAGSPIPFHVIGSDQGLGTPTETDTLVFEPGGRYDVVFDFKALQGSRIIMENIGGDAPFGGAFGGELDLEDLFPDRQTDRIMAFDVADERSISDDAFDPDNISPYGGNTGTVTKTRKVALFEGNDEFGRLQPLLGVVNDDDTATAYTWFQETTETPTNGDTEIWEIYNFTGDAHPVHLHLVNFEILGRQEITFDEGDPVPVLQHNGTFGTVAEISNIQVGGPVDPGLGYVENAPKDMVTALPEQVTRIKATFDKPGRYVWHCHILSHEDHEMMRVMHVGPGA
jgi:FtsP/CotA-like multicopper oxidase with cupredoxin domain